MDPGVGPAGYGEEFSLVGVPISESFDLVRLCLVAAINGPFGQCLPRNPYHTDTSSLHSLLFYESYSPVWLEFSFHFPY